MFIDVPLDIKTIKNTHCNLQQDFLFLVVFFKTNASFVHETGHACFLCVFTVDKSVPWSFESKGANVKDGHLNFGRIACEFLKHCQSH